MKNPIKFIAPGLAAAGIAGLIRFDGELGQTAAVKHLIQA